MTKTKRERLFAEKIVKDVESDLAVLKKRYGSPLAVMDLRKKKLKK